MSTPRVAAVHDLSGFGRCSMTIALPTLAAMGVQCCPVLTAYLSTHTGGFADNTFLDLTNQMAPVAAHWLREGVTFDGIYTGFMGSREQITLTAELIEAFKKERTIVVVDPVMGDHGKPYRTYTAEMCRAMGELADRADVIVPNRTEAAILLGVDYGEIRLDSREAGRYWAQRLSRNGDCSVVLTGVDHGDGRIGSVCFDRATGETGFALAPKVEESFHGTGDLFASVLTGGLVKGKSLAESAQLAAEFTSLCAARMAAQPRLPRREGIDFEPLLWRLGQVCNEGGVLSL